MSPSGGNTPTPLSTQMTEARHGAIEEALIQFLVAGDNGFVAEALGPLDSRHANVPIKIRIGQETKRQAHSPIEVAYRKQEAGLPVKNHLGQAAYPGSQDRNAAGHGLQGGKAEAFRKARHQQQ